MLLPSKAEDANLSKRNFRSFSNESDIEQRPGKEVDLDIQAMDDAQLRKWIVSTLADKDFVPLVSKVDYAI